MTELSNLELFLPSLEAQREIVAQIEAEQALVAPSQQLIEVFTKKIADRVNEIFS